MDTLPYTALTTSGDAFDIEFPLHPLTRSSETVGAMITGLLETLSRYVESEGDVSDGDVLQALAMVIAVRARIVGAEPASTVALIRDLVAKSARAAQEATRYKAAHG